ncbi:MAG: nucleotidyltransferase domain-containing protein [Cyanobacteria bacterium J06649_4]
MGKTVSQLTPEELKQYDPTRNAKKGLDPERWKRAATLLPKLAALLREQFGAERVQVFGSFVDKDSYTIWSDIDIAAWGIPPQKFYKAIEALNGLSSDIKVDLVDPSCCGSWTLRQIIEEEGLDV